MSSLHACTAANPILKHLERCTSVATLRQVHAQLLLHGLHGDNYVAVKLIAFCTTTLRSPQYARAIFNSISSSANIYVWTTIIASYSKHLSTFTTEALVLFRDMLRCGHRPNHFTLSSALKACSSLKAVTEGIQVHSHLHKIGFGSYIYVQAALLDMYANFAWIEDARKLFGDVLLWNVAAGNAMIACYARAGDAMAARVVFDEMPERDPISWNSLISVYAQQGNVLAARDHFGRMPERNVNSWNMMISMYSRHGEWRDAVELFGEMRLGAVRPDAATMAVVMSACAQLGSLKFARQVHGFLEKCCIEMNCYVVNSLSDMYAKCGSVKEAYRAFANALVKDMVSYNVIIGAFAHHGQGQEALDLFCEMVQDGFQPDAITFLGILSACRHAGLVDAGRYYFDSMRGIYAIEPSADHIACMVDLYGRAGLIEEAHDLLRTASVKLHAGVWGALLNACRKHHHVTVGKIAARELLRIEPWNPGNYILLSNIYARGQQWDAVGDVRRLMRGNVVDKTAGCSWIEVDCVVHEFLMGDVGHPKLEDIYTVLVHLYLQLL